MIYIISLIFSILSSLRFAFLPEFQLSLLVIFIFFSKKNLVWIYFLIIVYTSNFYGIPDSFFRFNSSIFPSFYTKSIILDLAAIDIFTLILFLFAFIKFVSNFWKYLKIFKALYLYLPYYLLLISIFSFLFLDIFASNMFSYLVRNYMLFFSLLFLLINLNLSDIFRFSKFALISFTIKMIISILIPLENPLYRDTGTLSGIIYFLGDEYLTLGLFISILILFDNYFLGKNYFFIYLILITFILSLALISQRRGSIPYFASLYLLLIIPRIFKFSFITNLSSISLYFSSFLLLAFGQFVFPEFIQNEFSLNLELFNSAIRSLEHMLTYNPINFFFGVSPIGKYFISGLSLINDNIFAWGGEVGETFRYAIWFIPGDRLILNSGFIGFIIYFIFILRRINFNPFAFYLLLNTIVVFYFGNINPLQAISSAIALSFYIKTSFFKLSLNNYLKSRNFLKPSFKSFIGS